MQEEIYGRESEESNLETAQVAKVWSPVSDSLWISLIEEQLLNLDIRVLQSQSWLSLAQEGGVAKEKRRNSSCSFIVGDSVFDHFFDLLIDYSEQFRDFPSGCLSSLITGESFVDWSKKCKRALVDEWLKSRQEGVAGQTPNCRSDLV